MANPFVLPLAGTPGKSDPRNPTLVPNFGRPVVSNAGPTISNQSPAGALLAEPRADATATATIGGTVTTGDEITLEVLSGLFPGGFISHTYTTVGGDTVSTIAEQLADLFGQDPVATANNLSVVAAGAVLTFNHNGPLGNFSVLASPLSEPSKITIGGTALTGDQINILFSGPGIVLTPATAIGVLGGTYAAGDTVGLTFTNNQIASFPITKTYTVLAGDGAAEVAAGLVALIEADANLNAAMLFASANGATISFSQQGVVGNNTVITEADTGGETIAFDPSNGQMAGGAGQAGGVLVQVPVTTGQSVTTIAGNVVTAIGANPELVSLGITATNSAGVVSLVVPASDEPINISSWVNTITPTATIAGAIAAADVLNLTFTAAYLPGGAHTVSHTVTSGETTVAILAADIAAQINQDAVMVSAGIGATSAAGVITFTYQPVAGQLRFSQSVSPGSETITLTTAPTDTAVTSTKATETITLAPTSGALSGGTGPIFATNNFEFAPSTGGISAYFFGQPYDLGYDVLSQMVAQGMPIT